MLGKLSSAFSSLNPSRHTSPPPPPTHDSVLRAKEYALLADKLHSVGVPVSTIDCAACDLPCPTSASDNIDDGSSAGKIIEVGRPWDGKTYAQYVEDKYGDLGSWPDSIDTDWDSDLAGSAQGGRGRIAIVSTGKSDWDRDHYVSM